ncbi:MAG: flagellar hook-basal body protein [Firmicutes bacterium]|nr:flagellar hook-basal body protein [Bacillota bacterium]
MLRTIQTGYTGLLAYQRQMDNVGNNIANINTTAYKKDKVSFSEVISQKIGDTGVSVVSENKDINTNITNGVKVARSGKVFDQGVLKETKRSLDLAIDGQGFFKVLDDNGNAFYTRDGNFSTDKEGNFVTANGYYLEGLSNTELTNTKEILISKNGVVDVVTNDGSKTNIGSIKLYDFVNRGQLTPEGENLFTYPQEKEGVTIEGNGKIRQGYLEQANVNLVDEMSDLITAQKAFSFSAKAITTADQMWQMTNNLRR